MRITLSGQNYSLIEGRPTPPSRGDYVAYAGLFYPVSAKTGYPLSIVADLAGKAYNKIVLVPAEEIIAFLSGTGRMIRTGSKPAEGGEHEKNEFSRALLRLTLLSSHKEVVSLGDIPLLGSTPCEKVDIDSIDLPPVIRRSRTWIMVALFAGILALSFLSGVVLKSKARDQVLASSKAVAIADAELTQALESVKDGRTKLAAPSHSNETVPSGTEALPTPNGSFMDQFYAAKTTATNQIRVTNGAFQY